MFEENIRIHADKVLFAADSGETFRYGELGEFGELLRKQVPNRSLVFCLCTNAIGSIAGYMGFVGERTVPLLLDVDIDDSLLERLIATYKPNYVWLPSGKVKRSVNGKKVFSVFDFDLIELNDKPIQLHPDLGLLLSTSGSTGSPKLVRLSYKNIRANAKSIAEYLEIGEDDRPITSLPSHYSYGLSVINSHYLSGATLLLTNASVTQREFWGFARTGKATSIAGVPYTYEMLSRIRFFTMELPDLRVMTQAGGRLASGRIKEFIEYANAKSKRFIVMYGQTEATARMSYLPFSRAEEKLGSVGIAIPDGQFRIVDDTGSEILESGVTGNLFYTGPNVSMGYAESDLDLSEGDHREGVLETGDLAYKDPDGYVYISGRKSRFAKIFGNRVSLDDVEQLVCERVIDCACVGQEDLIRIFITNPADADALRDFIAEKTGLNRRAFEVKVVSAIPKNSSGKIQYSVLQESGAF